MTAGPDRPAGDGVHRPRTVTPGLSGQPATVVQPRTVGALGRPDPIITSPSESIDGPPRSQRTWPIDHHEPSFDDPEPAPEEVDEPDPDDPDDLWVHDSRDSTMDRKRSRASGGAPPVAGQTEADVLFAEPATGVDASEPGRMLRNNLFVASGTLTSRLTGLARSVLIVGLLVEGLGDAYLTANNTPNMIYELILGGVLTATLVPLFTDDLEKGGKGGATDAIISFALVALAIVTLVAVAVAPLIILVLSTGSTAADRSDYVAVAIPLALLFAPQVFFYGLMAVWSAVLNARHRFLAAAWAPVLNNLIAIATLVVVWQMVDGSPTLIDAKDDSSLLVVLGMGTTAGIAVMALSLYPSLRRAGVRMRFKLNLKHPAVRRALRLSGWTLGYVLANQVAVIVIGILTKPGSDGTRDYQTAYQFFQLPHGLLAVSIMVTFEPLLGRADARGDRTAFNTQLLLGFRLIGLLVIPAAVGYVALPKGLDHRTFVATGNLDTALGLTGIIAAFAVGLPGFSSYLYALRAFYAMKNTKIPFQINCFENVVNIVTAVVFVRIWGIVGLALSFAVAYTVAAVVATVVLTRHSPGFDWRGLVRTWVQLLLAAAVMGGIVYGIIVAISPGSALAMIPTLTASIAAGAIVYFATIYFLRVQGISELFGRLPGLRRFADSAPPGAGGT